MDPELLRVLGYSAFNPPGFTPRRPPQLPVFRPPEDMPAEAYGGTIGLGEMGGMSTTPPAGPSSGPGVMSRLMSLLTPEAPQLTTAAASPVSTDPLTAPSPYQEPYRSAPMPGAPEDYRTQPYQAPAGLPVTGQATSLGASLEPATVPLPRPRPIEAGPGANVTGGPTMGDAKRLTDALKGVVAPAAPVAQKVGSPHAPPMGKLQGGNVAELLAQLGIGPQQAFPGLKLPSTLGQALGGR